MRYSVRSNSGIKGKISLLQLEYWFHIIFKYNVFGERKQKAVFIFEIVIKYGKISQ